VGEHDTTEILAAILLLEARARKASSLLITMGYDPSPTAMGCVLDLLAAKVRKPDMRRLVHGLARADASQVTLEKTLLHTVQMVESGTGGWTAVNRVLDILYKRDPGPPTPAPDDDGRVATEEVLDAIHRARISR